MFIAISPNFAERFREKLLSIIGDDIEAQLRATITHRVLIEIFKRRGVKKERTYQIITEGITDFLNMLNRKRQASKKESKLEAEQSVAVIKFDSENTRVGTGDYFVWRKASKDCFIRM